MQLTLRRCREGRKSEGKERKELALSSAGSVELSAPHDFKMIEPILSVHCVLLLIFHSFQILSHFHKSVFNEF